MNSPSRPVAVVTGGSRGIGRAVAEDFLNQGYRVAICARTNKELERTANELAKQHESDSLIAQALDVGDESAVTAFVQEILRQWQQVDVLVNNAGINHQRSWDLPPQEFKDQLTVNTLAPFLFAREVIPQMLTRQSGYIFNIGSICSFIGFPTVGAYTASKFALRGWNESLFRELVPQGVRVTLLAPSWVDTQMSAHSPVPPEQRLRPQDITSTIRYLLSLSPSAAVREILIECTNDLS